MTVLTMLRVGWISVRRDPVVLALTFLLPVLFFSIFALVFGNQQDPTSRVRVAVVDEDHSGASKRLIDALGKEGGLRLVTTTGEGEQARPLTRDDAEGLIKDGTLSVAVVLPQGLADVPLFGPAGQDSGITIELLADVSDPVATQMVSGLLQKAAFTSAPASMARSGMAMFEQYAGPMTPAQREALDAFQQQQDQEQRDSSSGGGVETQMGIPIDVVNVLQPEGSDTTMISFYAAGIGVMFLLFSCSGAGGALLEEEESGTLDRLIGSRAGMSGVLLGKWVFILLLGALQLTVMFAWGQLVFGLPLASHLPGFLVMTVVTAGAAAGFGLVLATLARSRAQLSGLSTIIILAMSALGGSMFPRFLMSDTMQQVGLLTFNGWALDGYLKVFWYEAPLLELRPQVAVLSGLAVVFLLTARRLARRWETV